MGDADSRRCNYCFKLIDMNTKDFWKGINENYPVAVRELSVWTIKNLRRDQMDDFTKRSPINTMPTITGHYPKNPRDLYDHFDGLEIKGHVYLTQIGMWGYHITYYVDDQRRRLDKRCDNYERGDTEELLFTRKFEIREKQLTEGEQLNE